MTKREVEHILKVLEAINNPDGNVIKAIAFCNKQLVIYDSMRGQLQENYEYTPW
jgi:hypothetical protein